MPRGLALLACPVLARQELYLLGRFNKIWRIDAHDTANPVPVHVVTWGAPGLAEPVGLERDPLTGDFLLLTSPWTRFGTPDSQLSRVDPVSGATTVIDPATCTTTVTPLDGLVGSFWAPVATDTRGLVVGEDLALLEIDPAGGQVAGLGVALPGTTPLGAEVDVGGEVYVSGLAADLWRYEPQNAQWVQLLPDWNSISNAYDLAFSEATDGADFSAICDGAPNSTGVGASLELIGTGSVGANDLELYSHQLPPSVTGYYLMGTTAGMTPVGQGTLCIAPPVFRFSGSVLDSGSVGRLRFPLDLTQLATGGAAQAGDVFLFQLWYRDQVGGNPTSNLSAAVSVTFH